nr:uncharacterized protein LOC119715470 [Anas platyrhynchos]
MLGQPPWARLSPSGTAVLLLVICAGVTNQDICSSPGLQEHGGNYQAPVLYLNTSSAQEGEIVFFQCTIDAHFPATRVVFCKNGQEEHSLKAQHGRVIYPLVVNITSRSAGTYTCGYQQRSDSNWVRSSALSAPWTLSVPGETQPQGGGDRRDRDTTEAGAVCCSRQGMSLGWFPHGSVPSPPREPLGGKLLSRVHLCCRLGDVLGGGTECKDPRLRYGCSKDCPLH